MKKNGFVVWELLIVIGIFGVVYFFVANKMSYAFMVNYENDNYKIILNNIQKEAKIYAENTKDFFNDDETIYLTVNDLVEKGLLTYNKNGVVEDPRDINKNLNNLKLKISKINDKVEVKIIS